MRKVVCLTLTLLGFQTAMASDNVAGCEAVMIEKVLDNGEPTGAFMQTFAPAAEVLATIYDDEDGVQTEIDGRKVQAILCERSSVIPTLRDFPILATGIPFALSTNFEAPDSRSVTVYFKDGEFHHIFKGDELPEEQQAELSDAIEVFNLQPHDLGDSNAMDEEESKSETEESVDEDFDDSLETDADLQTSLDAESDKAVAGPE